MKTLFGVSLLLVVQLRLMAVQVGDTLEQVYSERGQPPGKLGAAGFVILAYPDATIRLQGNRVVRISGPPRELSVVPTPKPKPKPKPVPTWVSDLDDGFSQAREKNRHMLLFFTGSGWGERTQKLEAEILTEPEFVLYAQEHLVLVKLNFPRAAGAPAEHTTETTRAAVEPTTAASSNAETPTAEHEAKVATEETKSEDYPMVYIFDSEGRPIGSLGYPEGGPSAFIDALKKL